MPSTVFNLFQNFEPKYTSRSYTKKSTTYIQNQVAIAELKFFLVGQIKFHAKKQN